MAQGHPGERFVLLALLAVSGCASGARKDAGRPEPSPAGVPTGPSAKLAIGPLGASLASPDGRMTLTVPPGAVASTLDFTIDEITNTAPGGVGVAYRIGPSGSLLAVPATLTFQAGALAVDALAISTQDGPSGWWTRPPGLLRDAGAKTLAIAARHFSDWALVSATTARDLLGSFALDSTLTDRPPFHAAGQATLSYAGEGPDRSYYIQSGTLAIAGPLASGTATCTPTVATVPDAANLAEARWSASLFEWGVSGHWDLACTGPGGSSTEFLIASFDTLGINLLGCSRAYLAPPVMGQDRLQGSYAIDCGPGGRLTGSWDFASSSCGGPCTAQPDPVCHLGVVDCSSGASRCVDGAAVTEGAPCNDGNACTRTDTCQAGTCTGGNPVACAALDQCHDPGVCDPATGACSTPAKVDGAPCNDGSVCTQVDACVGGACVGGSPATCAALDSCHLAGTCDSLTGCSNPPAPDGTPCNDGNACTPTDACQGGLCTGTSGVVCAALDQCHDVGACDPLAGTCSNPAKPDGSTCDDGNLCTQTDTCAGGACAGANPKVCAAQDECHLAGTCDPATGSCSNPSAPDGTSCSGGLLCLGGSCSVRNVTGTRLATFWPDAGPLPPAVPADALVPPLATVDAFVAGGGGFTRYPGTLAADGSFSIPGVPAGSYLLVVVDGSGEVGAVETSASTVDLGFDRLGRADALPATLPTDVTVSVAGLDPWNPAGDQVQVASSNADVWDSPIRGGQVTAGANAGNAVESWNASAGGGPQHLLGAADALWVHDLAARSTGATGLDYRTAAHATAPAPVAMSDGLAASLSVDFGVGDLVTTPFTGSILAQWDVPAFEALLPTMGPGAAPIAAPHALRVAASAHALAAPAPVSRAGSPDLFLLEVPAGTALLDLGALSYGQFLPAPLWIEWRGVSFEAAVSYLAAGASLPVSARVSVGGREPMVPAPATPIVPTLSPPQGLQIGGASAAVDLAGVGLTPTLSWTAPAAGTATSYSVEVLELTLRPATTESTFRRVGVLSTGRTQVSLPPGLLQAGGRYFARVTANARAPDPFDTAPSRAGNVSTWAAALTATFAP
jgi:hypothetical protein